MKKLSKEIKDQFEYLVNQLSPENISCDGECSKAEVNKRYKKLRAEWKALEKKAGETVTEDDVWTWIFKEL